MDIDVYIKKIDYYLNEIKGIDLIYVQKIVTRLYSLKQLLYSSVCQYILDLEDEIDKIFILIENLILLYKNNEFDSLKKMSDEILAILDRIILERSYITHHNNITYNTDTYYENVIKNLNEIPMR